MQGAGPYQPVARRSHPECSYEKVFWKYAGKLQVNTHAEVWFQ